MCHEGNVFSNSHLTVNNYMIHTFASYSIKDFFTLKKYKPHSNQSHNHKTYWKIYFLPLSKVVSSLQGLEACVSYILRWAGFECCQTQLTKKSIGLITKIQIVIVIQT